ncbi:MAG: hypothetical protein ABIQ73_15880 [Acidimicrobiales bacterium]
MSLRHTHRQQEGRDGEIWFVDQCLQRLPPADRRQSERSAGEQRAAGEGFDVTGLVGNLDREQLHHFAKVRVHLRDESSGNDQRRDLVLDEVGHHLDDGGFDELVVLDWCGPVDGGGRIPLTRGGLRVETGRLVGPDMCFVVEREKRVGPTELDVRTAGRYSPVPRRTIDNRPRDCERRVPGGLAVAPRRTGGSPPREPRDRAVGVSIFVAVAPRPGPHAQVHPQLGMRATDIDRGARLELVDGVLDDDVRAFVETEMAEID